MSNVFNESGQFTDEFISLLDEIEPLQTEIESRILLWLRQHDCNCLDYRLGPETVIQQMSLHAQAVWLDCAEAGMLATIVKFAILKGTVMYEVGERIRHRKHWYIVKRVDLIESGKAGEAWAELDENQE